MSRAPERRLLPGGAFVPPAILRREALGDSARRPTQRGRLGVVRPPLHRDLPIELEALPVEKIVIGHGGPVLEDKSYLTQVRQFLEAAVAYSTESHAAGLSDADAIAAAVDNAEIQAFRRQFVSEEQDAMFDQMVGWTILRAYAEF